MQRDSTPNRRRARRGAPWTPVVLAAVLREAGFGPKELAARWECSKSIARRAVGVDPETLVPANHTDRRNDIVSIVAEHLDLPRDALARELRAMWAQAAQVQRGTA